MRSNFSGPGTVRGQRAVIPAIRATVPFKNTNGEVLPFDDPASPAAPTIALGVPQRRVGFAPSATWNLGKEAPPAPAQPEKPAADANEDALKKYAPVAASLISQLSSMDPITQREVFKAKLKNLKKMKKAAPAFLALFLDSRIRVLEAKLKASEYHVAEYEESQRNWRTWRTITQVGGLVAVGIGVSTILYLLSKARSA